MSIKEGSIVVIAGVTPGSAESHEYPFFRKAKENLVGRKGQVIEIIKEPLNGKLYESYRVYIDGYGGGYLWHESWLMEVAK